MAVISLLFLAVMYVVHHPLMVSDRMDLDTLARSRQLEKRMSEEMRQLELEFEQRKRAAEEKQKAENFWRGDTSSDHSCDRTCSTSRPLIPAAMRRRRRSVACLSPPTTGLPTSPRGRCWNPFTNTTSRTSPGTCPAPGTMFVLEMRDLALGRRCGCVLVESECVCKREKLLGDVLCLVHHHRDHSALLGKCNSSIKAALCTGSYLDVCKTVQWFRNMVGNAWALVAHKYDFKLSLPPSTTSCKLRLDYRSGRFLSIRLVLGVQREDTLVYLVSQAPDQEQFTSVDWPESFAACEHLFLKLVGRFAPENTCHLKCLQIILSLRDLQSLPQGASHPILTSYHFKTALMHLLLQLPLTDWQHGMLSQRLQDILWFLGRGLQRRSLHHFLIGNTFLPLTIPIPKTFRNAEPVNLFQHLVLNPMAHSQAVEEFHNLLTQVKALPCASLAGAH
ncbi:inositol 1,4,5-trisphosphate receptor-interacting protein-like 1 isoform 2-T3 [Megaptera novaeangliae]